MAAEDYYDLERPENDSWDEGDMRDELDFDFVNTFPTAGDIEWSDDMGVSNRVYPLPPGDYTGNRVSATTIMVNGPTGPIIVKTPPEPGWDITKERNEPMDTELDEGTLKDLKKDVKRVKRRDGLKDGDVIRFKWTPTEDGTSYTYAALRAGDGRWWFTGRNGFRNRRVVTYTELLEIVAAPEVSEVAVAGLWIEL